MNSDQEIRDYDAWFQNLTARLREYVVVHRNGGIVYTNQAFAAAVGSLPDKLEGTPVKRFIVPEDCSKLQQAERDLDAGFPVEPFEISIYPGDGSLRQVLANLDKVPYGGIASTLMVLSDVTGQRLAEQELRASEERYRLLGEIIPFGVWTTDRAGNFTYCSDSFMSLLGLLPEDLLEFRWIQKLPPQDRDRTLTDWKQFMETCCFWDYEYRVIDQMGKERFILSRGAPILDEQGVALSFSGIHLDITELRSAIRRLEASLREKEVVIKEVHHRVKNNMAVISGFISLQSGYTEDPVLVKKLEECQQRVKTMALVHEHLYQGKSLEFIDSAYYIGSLVHDLVNASLLNTPVDCEICVDHMNINLDIAIPCGLIVNELVTNALKHAFSGRTEGRIRVLMQLTPQHRYHLVVEDNGIGLPPDFECSCQSTLGMQLVDVLVNQLGGDMAVSSEQGTRFVIEFPEKF
jgi:PAS domain S-box-containing protein